MDDRFDERLRDRLSALDLAVPPEAPLVRRTLTTRSHLRVGHAAGTPSLGVAAALVLALVALVSAGLAARYFVATEPTVSPTAVATASANPSPAPTPDLARYNTGWLSFDYPANWWLIPVGADHSDTVWGPILGTGHFTEDCATNAPISGSGAGGSCEAPAWWVSPGEVVVVFKAGFSVVAPTPPPGAIQLQDGIRATETEYSTTSVWQLYTPQLITVLADYAAPNIEVSREQVRQLIESMRLSTPPPASAGASASS